MKGLVAVPIYNERDNLAQVIDDLTQCLLRHETLLFIDDGSTDGSRQILEAAGVRFLSHPINLGYEETLRTAMTCVMDNDFSFVVFFDADGQHRTQDLRKIIEEQGKEGCDLIVGNRYRSDDRHRLSLRRLVASLFSRLVTLVSGKQISDVTCGLKLISRDVIPRVIAMPTEDMHAELIVGLARMGARIGEVPIDVLPRGAGNSMYHFSKGLLYPAKTLLCLCCGLLMHRKVPKLTGDTHEYTK